MMYYLFRWLHELGMPGAGVFEYITFRAVLAMITSLVVGIFFGKRIIHILQRRLIGEDIRDLDLAGQMAKKGTPTMGGLIILLSIIIPTLLFAKLDNIYIILMLVTTIWLGVLGFLDDYLKQKKHDKAGLRGKYKIMGQIGLGFIVGGILYFSPDVVIREYTGNAADKVVEIAETCDRAIPYSDYKSTKTTIPFFKNNEFDYKYPVEFLGKYADRAAWIVFIIAVIFIVTAVSNGANLTDGLDGLATGTAAIIGVVLGILAYISGNRIAAEYLHILYIPNTGELTIYISCFIGAMIGFLWYNSYPAQVFMGDTGSLAIGGIIAVFAIIIKKELLLPILCGVYLVESLSVIIQTTYFKYTKRRYGVGKRVFLMAPIHHHYQKKNIPESKIVARFWIISLILAAISIITLKLR